MTTATTTRTASLAEAKKTFDAASEAADLTEYALGMMFRSNCPDATMNPVIDAAAAARVAAQCAGHAVRVAELAALEGGAT